MAGQDFYHEPKDSIAAWNAELVDAASDGKHGLLKKIPSYVNMGLCDALDVLYFGGGTNLEAHWNESRGS